MALKNYKSFPLPEEYLNYLLVIKGRSRGTITPYRTDLLMFFQFRGERQGVKQEKYDLHNYLRLDTSSPAIILPILFS
ncbi:MAG: site-specific integrase [Anaerovoracaceae bacterium]